MAGLSAETGPLHQLAAGLAAAGVELADLGPANTEAGRVVLANTRPPRATGHLANTLTARATGTGVTFASAARYWTFVHWGAPRRQLRARPFFVQAIQPSRDQLLGVYAAHVRTALSDVT